MANNRRIVSNRVISGTFSDLKDESNNTLSSVHGLDSDFILGWDEFIFP